MSRYHDDFCEGCHGTPEAKQVNLPADWQEGQDMPENVTVHATPRDPRKFVFIGEKRAQRRHYL